MFDQLFNCSETAVRHRVSPFLDARVRFLQHCQDVGSPRGTLRRKARELLAIIDQMNLQPEGAIRSIDIEAAARRWAYRQPSHYKLKDADKARKHFVRVAKQWFKFLGRLEMPPIPEYQHFLEEFATYMDVEKGLSPMTIRSECGHVARFLGRHCTDGRHLAAISIQQIDEAIAQKGSRDHCTRASIKFYADSLRAFFRYAEQKTWCRPGLAAAIMAPTTYQHELIPSGPSWKVVQKLLENTAGDRVVDIRDRAILMLLAVYGLRSEEVLGLQLEDLDWDRDLINIGRPKSRRLQQYPLASTVGDAILRYLQEVRLHRPSRHVFLTLRAPYGPLSRSSIWKAVNDRLRPLRLSIRHHGPHSLRHACASHLLSQGLSMKEIGDHLGHRSAESTCAYAKVDFAGLREVAEFDLGGLL
jgi:site-specific recombinase XerD